MTVVPLLLEDGATVATTREDYARAGGDRGKIILILGMEREQISAGQGSNVSYDLRIGGEYKDHRDPGKYSLAEDGALVLTPGAAVIIETEEFLCLPQTLFALIVPKVGRLQQGLSNTMSKVDPGYSGRLLVTLFNLGKTTVTLKRYSRFCSLCVFRVEEGAALYGKGSKSIEGQPKRPRWQRARDLLERNGPAVTTFHMLVTAGTAIVVLVQLAC